MGRKWSHVWRSEDGNFTMVAYGSTEQPQDVSGIAPCWFNDSDELTMPYGMLQYVGSGRGDWWERTTGVAS